MANIEFWEDIFIFFSGALYYYIGRFSLSFGFSAAGVVKQAWTTYKRNARVIEYVAALFPSNTVLYVNSKIVHAM